MVSQYTIQVKISIVGTDLNIFIEIKISEFFSKVFKEIN